MWLTFLRRVVLRAARVRRKGIREAPVQTVMLDVLAGTLDRRDLLLPLGLLTVYFSAWGEVALDGLRFKKNSLLCDP